MRRHKRRTDTSKGTVIIRLNPDERTLKKGEYETENERMRKRLYNDFLSHFYDYFELNPLKFKDFQKISNHYIINDFVKWMILPNHEPILFFGFYFYMSIENLSKPKLMVFNGDYEVKFGRLGLPDDLEKIIFEFNPYYIILDPFIENIMVEYSCKITKALKSNPNRYSVDNITSNPYY